MEETQEVKTKPKRNEANRRQITISNSMWKDARKCGIDHGIPAAELARIGLRYILYGVEPVWKGRKLVGLANKD